MLPAISVVIPAYNEAHRIGGTLRQTVACLETSSPQSELIVVNDGSTDATSAIARDALTNAKIDHRLLENFPNEGKGHAVRKGLLNSTKPIALFFDADLSTPLSEIPKVIEPIANGDVDLAFGSRALDRSLIGTHQSFLRDRGGRVFNLLVRLTSGLPFWDTQCGFKAFRMEVCRPLIERAHVIGFAFDVELLLLGQNAGLRLREIPVRWNHAEGSKVHFLHDSLRMLREILALRANAITS
jgi:dolichyl-phosphate beta-glucosyltransferase